MPLKDYPPTEMEPQRLTNEELNDPYQVIRDLFEFAHLPDIREIYWDWLKVTVNKSYDQQTKNERSTFLVLYEKLGKLIEVAHMLYRQNRETSIHLGNQTL
jgi:hypothetical protein